MQQQTKVNSWGRVAHLGKKNGVASALALAGVLLLSACGGSSSQITNNDLPDPGMDGVAPTLTAVSIKQAKEKVGSKTGIAKLGQSVSLSFTASEGLMTPVVMINGQAAAVQGSIQNWSAKREMNDADVDGMVTFEIQYQDVSGETGAPVSATTDASAVEYCVEGCADPNDNPLVGDWRLAGAGSLRVGPAPLDGGWYSVSASDVVTRACQFDDIFRFNADGSFENVQQDDTWLENWQGGGDEGSCGLPVAPHDGSTAALWDFDDVAGTLTLQGMGAHLGLAKAVNEGELPNVGAPESVTYTVETLSASGTDLTVVIEAGAGVFWTFDFRKAQSRPPIVGSWKLAGEGSFRVGPAALDGGWFSPDAVVIAARDCLMDDVFYFGEDGSFSNLQGGSTWLEGWQNGGADEACGAPVAPHDGSMKGYYMLDEAAGTLTLEGKGAHLGLPKAVNTGEVNNGAAIPDRLTYTIDVLGANGSAMTVYIESGEGVFWTFDFVKVSDAPIIGSWKLAGEGSFRVGPTPLDGGWFSPDAETIALRNCLMDDVFYFGADGTFANVQGGSTWLETWQGVDAEVCGTPVAPHDGSGAATYSYDAASGTLTIVGKGGHIGLPKSVNTGEINNGAPVPDTLIYTVDTLTSDGLSMTVYIESGAGVFWTFDLTKVADAPIVGSWKLAGEGSFRVGPTALDGGWFSPDTAIVTERACLLDDVFYFGADGTFDNVQGGSTWLETWQGVDAEVCGTPAAPHDGSADATYVYNAEAGTLTISGKGAHVGLPKAVNTGEISNGAAIPDEVTYVVEALPSDGSAITVYVESGSGVFWTFDLVK